MSLRVHSLTSRPHASALAGRWIIPARRRTVVARAHGVSDVAAELGTDWHAINDAVNSGIG